MTTIDYPIKPDRLWWDYDDVVAFWIGFEWDEERDEWVEREVEDDPYLPHLSDTDIWGLIDSHDDGRIDTLAYAYTELRKRILG